MITDIDVHMPIYTRDEWSAEDNRAIDEIKAFLWPEDPDSDEGIRRRAAFGHRTGMGTGVHLMRDLANPTFHAVYRLCLDPSSWLQTCGHTILLALGTQRHRQVVAGNAILAIEESPPADLLRDAMTMKGADAMPLDSRHEEMFRVPKGD